MKFADRVTLVEVAPRDGLQSLPDSYPTDVKVELIELLAETGVPKIEVTGFVHPKVIPQLADAEEVMARVRRFPGVVYRALVPNQRGAERAVAAGVDEVLGLITASDTYNRKNANMTVEENLVQAAGMAKVARDAGVPIVMAIGIAMFCPYEGDVPETHVLGLIDRMRAEGVEEFYVATSVGLDGPRKVHTLCSQILDRWPELTLGVHLHNTNGMALANAVAAMDAGVSVFEGSICGIGGGIRMPHGIAHFGNVSTEDLAHMFLEMGVETGVDLQGLIEAGHRARDLLGLETTFSYASQGARRRLSSSVAV